MNWLSIDKSTEAAEIPGAGCLIRVGKLMSFAPNVSIKDGKLVATQPCSTIISFSGGELTSGSSAWVGDAGTKLDNLLKARDTLAKVNKFIIETWKITPNSKQLKALERLLKEP
jgi:hypothetical protein